MVGDWGTGLPRARAVGAQMAEEVRSGLAAGRDVHVVHLGDVYYSGDRGEYDRRLLAEGLWPATLEQSRRGATSWSLNGNHDTYSGGWAYFGHLLADPRFAAQRSADGRGTSYFRLSSPSWDFVGLDTAWDPNPLTTGHRAVLEEPQAEYVARIAADGAAGRKRLVLFSHHQLVSVYAPHDIGAVLPGKLARVLRSGRVTAWLWGHEHRCMGFAASGGVAHPRCVGHGGVPVQAHPMDDPVPSPGIWEERGFLDALGTHWGRFGFVVVDLGPDRLSVRYRDDRGAVVRRQEIA